MQTQKQRSAAYGRLNLQMSLVGAASIMSAAVVDTTRSHAAEEELAWLTGTDGETPAPAQGLALDTSR